MGRGGSISYIMHVWWSLHSGIEQTELLLWGRMLKNMFIDAIGLKHIRASHQPNYGYSHIIYPPIINATDIYIFSFILIHLHSFFILRIFFSNLGHMGWSTYSKYPHLNSWNMNQFFFSFVANPFGHVWNLMDQIKKEKKRTPNPTQYGHVRNLIGSYSDWAQSMMRWPNAEAEMPRNHICSLLLFVCGNKWLCVSFNHYIRIYRPI